jgi:O-antigen ligase
MEKIKKKLDLISLYIIMFIPLFYIFSAGLLNLSFILISLFFLFICCVNKDFSFLKDKFFIYLYIFWAYLLLSAIFIHKDTEISLKSFFYIRYIIFPIAIYYFLKKNIKSFNKIKIFYLIIIFFVVIDTWIQFFYGKDIFGYGLPELTGRLSGPFGKELIVGGYLSLVGVLAILINFYKKKKLFLNNQFIFYLLFLVSTIIISGERASILILFLFLFFNLLLNKGVRKKFLLILFLAISIFFIFINFSSNVKWRMYGHLYSLSHPIIKNNQISEIQNDEFNQLKVEKLYKNYIVVLKSFKDTQWGAHWLTAIEISKDNLLFGSGIRTFRIVCKQYDDIVSLSKDSRCSTHPHNIFLEILSETGTIGLILILLFFFSFFKTFIIKSNNNNLTIAIGALILAVIFPLKPTGAFFSSWYGSLLWYLLGYYYFSLKCLDKQK